MRPLHYQRCLLRCGLRLLDIFVKPTSACFTPENNLVSVVERPLDPRRRICQVQGAGMGAPVSGALGVALCRAWRAQVAAVVPCGARRGAAGGGPPGLARAGVETPPSPVEVGPSSSLREPRVDPLGWWVRVMVWSLEPASGGSPRLESRDLERARPVSWASRSGRVEDLSLPRVARSLTGRYVVACCL